MPVSCRDLLAQAKELPVSAEAHQRLLVGRAYYACYHRCLDWEQSLPQKGKAHRKTKGVHQQLIERLQRPHASCSLDQVKRSKWLAERLDILRELRACADYRLEEPLSDEQAGAHVKLAQTVFNRCDHQRRR